MSTVPPATPPPPTAPPPTAPAGLAPLPWEDRERRGFFEALLDTMGLFLSRPSEAWARTRESGDMGSPLLFGVIVGWFSFVIHSLIARVITIPLLFPGPFARQFAAWGAYGATYGGVRFVVHLIFGSIFVTIALFIAAVILHVGCLIAGALSQSSSGFEGSFRTTAYSNVTSLATIIPGVGWLIAFVWWIILAIMGVQRLHRTTQGKATAGVLIPVVVCCGGIVVLALLVGAAIMTHWGR